MSEVDARKNPNPVTPELLEGGAEIKFRCHRGIDCWNACCSNIDITLTPYDIIRLKQRLSLQSHEFLREYTVPFEFDKDGIAGVKLKAVEGGTACRFMTDEGCSVYEDRPTSCRYYPVGLVSMRREDEYTDRKYYALVEEEICHGDREDHTLTIDQYRQDQQAEEYDERSRGWRQLVLKKKSSGPTIGKPSLRSRQLFFMANYDMDRFREFVRSEGFVSSFELQPNHYQQLLEDDVALMEFGAVFLKHVFFGDELLKTKDGALEARLKQKEEAEAAKAEIEQGPQRLYDPSMEPVEQ